MIEKKFIESICAIDGEIRNLAYHQRRVNQTFQQNFKRKAFELEEFLKPLEIPQKGKIKIRVEYAEKVHLVEWQAYQAQQPKHFTLVEAEGFDYSFKYKNRDFFKAFQKFEPIFIQKNQITDSSYANLVFYKNREWFTPETYLLNGTKRQFLLDNKLIKPLGIGVKNLVDFEKFGLINAMLNLEENIYPIEILFDKSS